MTLYLLPLSSPSPLAGEGRGEGGPQPKPARSANGPTLTQPIELDGGQHGGPQDLIRQQWLQSQGYVVKRFWNNEVTFDLPTILACIAALAQSPPA